MKPPRAADLTHRVDRLQESDLLLMALREGIGLDWPGRPLALDGVEVAPYKTLYSTLASVVSEDPRRTWMVLEWEPSPTIRRTLGLPRKPGDIDILVGKLTDNEDVDLRGPILALEAGVSKLANVVCLDGELGDERKDEQANGLLTMPFEYVAVLGIVPEKTGIRAFTPWGTARTGHEPMISHESFLPELQRFPAPLGLVGTTVSAVPGVDPGRMNFGAPSGWLRKPERRTCDPQPWASLRADLAASLLNGHAQLYQDGGPYLIVRCREKGCTTWVMAPQQVPLAETLRPPCCDHARPEDGPEPKMRRSMASAIPVAC